MPKTTLQLPNGTTITIDGSVEDVERIVAVATESTPPNQYRHQIVKTSKKSRKRPAAQKPDSPDIKNINLVDVLDIVNLAKSCDDSEAIASKILDERNGLNRILLPMFLVHEHRQNSFGLTSGNISSVLKELGTPIDIRNVSTTLSSTARPYVAGDKVRRKGQPVGYKLTRRGVQHVASVLKGTKES